MDTIFIIISAVISLIAVNWLIRATRKAYKYQNPNGKIFHGGAWISFLSVTWPFGILVVGKDSIVLKIEGLDDEIVFTKTNLERIEVKRFLFGIKFIPKPYRIAYFWYLPFKLKNVTDALRGFNWLK